MMVKFKKLIYTSFNLWFYENLKLNIKINFRSKCVFTYFLRIPVNHKGTEDIFL